jgi:hypothetical protein
VADTPSTRAPLVLWEPLYPALLAVAALWLRRLVPSRALWPVSVAAVAISMPVFDVFTYAWSESLLLVFVALFLLDAERAVKNGGAPLVRLATWSALAALARYAGVSLAVSGALLLFADRARPRRQRALRAVLFLAASTAPLALWVARNAQETGSWFGARPEAGYSAWEASGIVLAALGALLFSPLLPAVARGALTAIVGVTVVVVFASTVRSHRPSGSRVALSAVAVVVPYLAMLVFSTATVAVDRANDRLLAPIALPLIGIGFAAAAAAAGGHWRSAEWSLRWRAVLVLMLVAVWLPLHAARTLYHAHRAWTRGIPGYTDIDWRGSEIARELPRTPLAGVGYSNAPDAYFYFTGHEARLSPRRSEYYTHESLVTGEVEAFPDSGRAHARSGRDTRLVWFLASPRGFIAPPAELSQGVDLRPEWTSGDGVVYRVTVPRGAASPVP